MVTSLTTYFIINLWKRVSFVYLKAQECLIGRGFLIPRRDGNDV